MNGKPPETRYSKWAMQCHRCPEDGRYDGSKGCPAWISREREVYTIGPPPQREETPAVGCGLTLQLDVTRALVRKMEGQAAATEQMRDLFGEMISYTKALQGEQERRTRLVYAQLQGRGLLPTPDSVPVHHLEDGDAPKLVSEGAPERVD